MVLAPVFHTSESSKRYGNIIYPFKGLAEYFSAVGQIS